MRRIHATIRYILLYTITFYLLRVYLIAFLPLSVYKNNNKTILKQLIMKENFVDIPIGLPPKKNVGSVRFQIQMNVI